MMNSSDDKHHHTSHGSCLALLRNILPSLTQTERRAAEYLLANTANVIHMTIIELAEACKIAEATVFRLCKKLGYSGFQQFKISLASELNSSFESVSNEVEDSDTVGIITGKIFQNIIEGLHDTRKIVDEQQLERAVNALCQARRLYAYGSGVSAVVAEDIEHRFIRFGIPTTAYADPHMQLCSATLAEPNDVVIAISHSGANQDVLQAVQVAKDSGATIIGITSYLRSPLATKSDITLCGMAREVNYRSEVMSSRLMHLALVDVLYVAIMLRQKEKITVNMQKIRQVTARRKV